MSHSLRLSIEIPLETLHVDEALTRASEQVQKITGAIQVLTIHEMSIHPTE